MYSVKSYEYSVTLNGRDISPYREALYNHFNNAPDSLWELDPNVINQGVNNFVIRQKEQLGRFQMSFSLTGSVWANLVVVDRGNGMTDAQLPLSGSPQLFSLGETFRVAYVSTSPRGLSPDIFIIETKDSITVLPKLYNDGIRFVFHAGDILKPLYSNDIEYGLDGLGVLSSVLTNYISGAIGGRSSIGSPIGAQSSAFKISHTEIATPCGTDTNISPHKPTSENLNIGGRIEPATIPMCIPYDGLPSTDVRLRHIGDLKYVKAWSDEVIGNQILVDNFYQQAFICIVSAGGDGSTPALWTLFPWEYGKQVTNI
jgi:hypothetical protein